jgi:hypothetical protein
VGLEIAGNLVEDHDSGLVNVMKREILGNQENWVNLHEDCLYVSFY